MVHLTPDPFTPQKKKMFIIPHDALRSTESLEREARAREAAAKAEADRRAAAKAKAAAEAAAKAKAEADKTDPDAIYAKGVARAAESRRVTIGLVGLMREAVMRGINGAMIKMRRVRLDAGREESEMQVLFRGPDNVRMNSGHCIPLMPPADGKFFVWQLQLVPRDVANWSDVYAEALTSLPDLTCDSDVESAINARAKGWRAVVKDAIVVLMYVCRCGVVGARVCATHDPIKKCASCPIRLDKRNLKGGLCATCFGKALIDCSHCGQSKVPRAHSCQDSWNWKKLEEHGTFRDAGADRGRRSVHRCYVQKKASKFSKMAFCPHCPVFKHDKSGAETDQLSFVLVRTLKKHLHRAHPRLYPSSYRRRCCNQVFTEKFKFERHLQSHSKSKNYGCSCGLRFKYSEGRSHHIRVASGEHRPVKRRAGEVFELAPKRARIEPKRTESKRSVPTV